MHLSQDEFDSMPEEDQDFYLEVLKEYVAIDQREWRQVVGFEDYLVSTDGLVQRLSTGLRVSTHVNWFGYEIAGLRREGQQYTRQVHRLVAEAFLGPCPEGKECSHLDHDKTNNVVYNLLWETRSQNMRRNYAYSKIDYPKDLS